MEIILPQVGVAAAVIAVTAIIHAIFTMIIRGFARIKDDPKGVMDDLGGVIRLTVVSLWLIAAHALSAGAWALAYVKVGISQTFADALYFALSTYTTLGFGDVLAPEEWQLLTGFASMNGLLMFGLSAAVLVDAAARIRTPSR
ncbi:two pore domain potassium channel family protein [Parvularcula sp. ZS-1/3]|uniref:Two pore domain potassium channel family protein n=1 Tax=Parvularcula mediterranea TaxID=2732508 RepID=A0A7Y3RM93_9PROT|nr:potassium channel family protein [Parvularcula mediterranea]NNU16585.1 two pore domain potassium channel family protein [Parvularcula mediterranea]